MVSCMAHAGTRINMVSWHITLVLSLSWNSAYLVVELNCVPSCWLLALDQTSWLLALDQTSWLWQHRTSCEHVLFMFPFIRDTISEIYSSKPDLKSIDSIWIMFRGTLVQRSKWFRGTCCSCTSFVAKLNMVSCLAHAALTRVSWLAKYGFVHGTCWYEDQHGFVAHYARTVALMKFRLFGCWA